MFGGGGEMVWERVAKRRIGDGSRKFAGRGGGEMGTSKVPQDTGSAKGGGVARQISATKNGQSAAKGGMAYGGNSTGRRDGKTQGLFSVVEDKGGA